MATRVALGTAISTMTATRSLPVIATATSQTSACLSAIATGTLLANRLLNEECMRGKNAGNAAPSAAQSTEENGSYYAPCAKVWKSQPINVT
jgi:hypothetical protein